MMYGVGVPTMQTEVLKIAIHLFRNIKKTTAMTQLLLYENDLHPK